MTEDKQGVLAKAAQAFDEAEQALDDQRPLSRRHARMLRRRLELNQDLENITRAFDDALIEEQSGTETSAVNNWQAVCEFEGYEFVSAAYRLILGRDADAYSRDHWVSLLHAGSMSKVEVLARLRYSREGRKRNVSTRGLLLRAAMARAESVPIVGWPIRFLHGFALLPSLHRRLRETEVRAALLRQTEAHRREATLARLADRQKNALHRLARNISEWQQAIDDEIARADSAGQWDLQASQVGAETTQDSPDSSLYSRFEDRFRGDPGDIRHRLDELWRLVPLEIMSATDVAGLDLGSGRGEWLELAAARGVRMRGIDTENAFVMSCRERGLDVQRADALEHLRTLPDSSVPFISAFHLVEHFSTADLLELLDQCARVLLPRGRLLIETPNSENLIVGAHTFWLDLSHKRPIAPDLLDFLLNERGLSPVETVRLRRNRLEDRLQFIPPNGASDTRTSQLNELIALAKAYLVREPDYAICAERLK